MEIEDKVVQCPVCGSKYIPALAGCYKCYERSLLPPTFMQWLKNYIFSVEFIKGSLDMSAIYGVNFLLMKHMDYTFFECMIQSLCIGWFASYIVNRK